MKYEIRNRFTGAVLFTAEICCTDDASEATERGLAVRWAATNGANLSVADLSGADLAVADLSRASLAWADLAGADLSRASLAWADLAGANLSGANLSRANLSRANISRADLSGADLAGADLSGAGISGANLLRANLSGVDLSGATLAWADLSGADLSGANLLRANLSGANLLRADLSGADLAGANLSRADLSRATGVAPEHSTPLLMLLDQPPGSILRAYKLVNADGEGHLRGGIRYDIGATLEEVAANTDPTEQCGAGINVATLDWCLREWRPGYRILLVEFARDDIACIPTATDGKFRLHRCKVVTEKVLDYAALGLMSAEAAA